MQYRAFCLEIKKFIVNKDTKVIHISTDHLYSGNGPHKEENVNPVNEYAQTKLQAEHIISSPRTLILRTNYVGKSFLIDKPTFTDWLYQSIKNKNKINLFKDIIFSPLHLFDLAENINFILNKPFSGTFNLGSSTSISKADFALKFAKALNINMRNYDICNSSEIKNRIERPKDMSMNVQLFEEKFKVKLPSISSTIRKCANDYQSLSNLNYENK